MELAMNDRFKPDGWHTVTPRVFTNDVAGLVGFLRTVFDAGGELRCGAPTEIRIGDSVVMISDGGRVREADTGLPLCLRRECRRDLPAGNCRGRRTDRKPGDR